MLRALHAIETIEPGGAETVCADVAEGLGGDYEPLGLVLGHGWISAEFERRGIAYEVLPLERSFDLRWVGRLRRLIKRQEIDIVHAHEFTMNCYCTLAARLEGVPVVCTTHGRKYYPERLYRRVAYRWVAGKSSSFVVVSRELRRFLNQEIGIPEQKIRVITNGIDISRFSPPVDSRSETRQALGIKASDEVIVVVAALFKGKGHEDLLYAFWALHRLRPSVILLVVGEGPEREKLHDIVAKLQLGRRVRMLGFRSDVPDILLAADVFVLPSYSEGLPLSVVEAMAAKRPVVASAVGGIPELIRDGEEGFLVAPGDRQSLSDALNKALNDPEARKSMGRSARDRAVSMYGMEAMLSQYRAVYDELVMAATGVAMKEP